MQSLFNKNKSSLPPQFFLLILPKNCYLQVLELSEIFLQLHKILLVILKEAFYKLSKALQMIGKISSTELSYDLDLQLAGD